MWPIFTQITEPANPISPNRAQISCPTLRRFCVMKRIINATHYSATACVLAAAQPSTLIEIEVCRVLRPEAAL